jgi:hypothetical protein
MLFSIQSSTPPDDGDEGHSMASAPNRKRPSILQLYPEGILSASGYADTTDRGTTLRWTLPLDISTSSTLNILINRHLGINRGTSLIFIH